MSLLEIATLVVIGGGLGGAAAFLARFTHDSGKLALLPGMTPAQDGTPDADAPSEAIGMATGVLLTAASMIVGVAGAFAIQFVLVTLDAAKLDATAKAELFVLSISVAAGFGARRLLPGLTARLEGQIRRATVEAAHARQEASEVRRNVSSEAQFAALVDSVLRGEAGVASHNHVIHELQKRLAVDPTDGNYVAPLGRLLKLRGKIDEALAVTDRYLQAKERRGERDSHYGSALYNKACYHALRFGKSWGEADLEAALDAVTACVQFNESNWDYIAIDDDLRSIRAYGQFLALMQQAPARLTTNAPRAVDDTPSPETPVTPSRDDPKAS